MKSKNLTAKKETKKTVKEKEPVQKTKPVKEKPTANEKKKATPRKTSKAKKEASFNLKNLIRPDIDENSLKITKIQEITGPKLVFGYLGIFLIVIGILVLLPLIMLAFYPKEWKDCFAFIVPGVSALVLGIILFSFIFRKPKGKLTSLEDVGMLISVWVLAIIFSAIPFFFFGYGFTQAFFESTSGYTSAGLTIMNWEKEIVTLGDGTTDVASHALFFHRALTELVGGIGLVLIVSSAISERSGLNLYLLEGHNDKLLPNLVKSARLIFTLYLSYIVLGTVLYIAVGVTPFDALCHSMTAVATGGFSTKANNVNSLVLEVSGNGQEWRGISVEIITEILMVLGGTNFVIHYNLLRGKFKVLRHFEYMVFFLTLFFVWPFMIIGFAQYFDGNIAAGFRYGTFEMLSGMSTAGFQAVDSYQAHAIVNSSYASGSPIYGFTQIDSSLSPVQMASGYAAGNVIKFPSYLLFLLGLMMMVGMQNGSTTGAIKQNRIALMLYDIKWRIDAAVGIPEARKVHTVYKFGQRVRVDRDEVVEAETFIALYVIVVCLGTTLIACIASCCGIARGDGTGDPFSWMDVFFEFSSAVGTVGLGCGITSYSHSLLAGGKAILWIEMVGMMLGRLELFVYFILGGKVIRSIRHHKFLAERN